MNCNYGGYGKDSCECQDQQARMEQFHKSQNDEADYTRFSAVEKLRNILKNNTDCGEVDVSLSCELLATNETDQLISKITKWHHDRNLIEGSTDKDQYLKLIEEAGELSVNICKKGDVADDIGDMIVVLINIAERNGLTITDCLATAWDDIKDRKGRMVNGVFVKTLEEQVDENP